MSTELQTTTTKAVSHPTSGGIGVIGLENIPVSMMGMPYIKIVQPTSQNIETSNGQEAPAGQFFFSDLQVAKPEITIALITAKKRTQTFERDGVSQDVDQVALLFKELETGHHYIMSLSPSNFRMFGKLMSLVTSEGWQAAWEKTLTLSTEKQEGQKGKYHTFKFQVGDKLSEEAFEAINLDWMSLGGYFEREDDMTEDVDPSTVTI